MTRNATFKPGFKTAIQFIWQQEEINIPEYFKWTWILCSAYRILKHQDSLASWKKNKCLWEKIVKISISNLAYNIFVYQP